MRDVVTSYSLTFLCTGYFLYSMNKILSIYNIFLKEYGPQGWWPIINNKTLICEYHKSAPRNTEDKLEIVIGAILAQNTQWHPNVVLALQKLKQNNLLDIQKILKIGNKRLANIIRSSGYHNQKAIKLKNFCNYLKKKYKGNINVFFRKDLSSLRNELLSIKGIGPETADSIILYAAKKPIFVIDSYSKRIMSRVGLVEEHVKYQELQDVFHNSLERDAKVFNEYHALFVEHAKNYCRKKPLCHKCPIKSMCNHGKQFIAGN